MGFAVSWITPLVMGAVVDRNPVATKDLRVKFNRFLQDVREALRTTGAKQASLRSLGGCSDRGTELEIDAVVLEGLPDETFVDFAGQGRLRWHRGIAHPILAGIEESYAAAHGRGWLDQETPAKRALLITHGPHGFSVADRWLLVQVTAAFLISYGNLGAGFIISYNMPTIGLGCGAMGYMIFAILTMAAALGEVSLEFVSAPSSSLRRLGHWALTGLEGINVCWLLLITIFQTFGVYQTCYCLGAMSDRRGGYIEFDDLGQDQSDDVLILWNIGTGIAGLILVTSLVYIVTQWMEQSHVMTSEYADARQGLMWTRRWKRIRGWVLWLPRCTVRGSHKLVWLLFRVKAAPRRRVMWSA